MIGEPPVDAGGVNAIEIPSSVEAMESIVGIPGLPMKVTVVCVDEADVKLESAAFVAVTKQVPVVEALRLPPEMVQPVAVPFVTE